MLIARRPLVKFEGSHCARARELRLFCGACCRSDCYDQQYEYVRMVLTFGLSVDRKGEGISQPLIWGVYETSVGSPYYQDPNKVPLIS